MSVCTSRGVGEYVASEAHTGLWGRMYHKDATTRPVVVFTGGPGDDRHFLTSAADGSQVPPVLADGGFPLISAAFGGANLWGNATTVTRIGQAWTHVKTLLGTATDEFVGVGISKGATALLNYAKANPSNVAALALFVPAVDIQDIHANDRGGAAASIETAHGGAPPDDLNPADNTEALSAIPQAIWYATDDATCTPATVTSYATAVGAEVTSLGAVGHSAASVPAADVLDFLQAAP